MYELIVERVFHAAHALRLCDGSTEPRHAHDWRVEMRIARPDLDAIDLAMDFHELERLADAALAPLRDATLNELGAFAELNPSAERVAEYIFNALQPALPDEVRLVSITVTEAPGCRAVYRDHREPN